MLAEQGHEVSSQDPPPSCSVWVIDAPDAGTLDRLYPPAAGEVPPALVVLTNDPGMAARLAHARVRGWACLSRNCEAADLSLAVDAAAAGLALMDLPAATVSVPAPVPPDDGLVVEALTARELQVLRLIADGLPNKGIARALGINENTAQ